MILKKAAGLLLSHYILSYYKFLSTIAISKLVTAVQLYSLLKIILQTIIITRTFSAIHAAYSRATFY